MSHESEEILEEQRKKTVKYCNTLSCIHVGSLTSLPHLVSCQSGDTIVDLFKKAGLPFNKQKDILMVYNGLDCSANEVMEWDNKINPGKHIFVLPRRAYDGTGLSEDERREDAERYKKMYGGC